MISNSDIKKLQKLTKISYSEAEEAVFLNKLSGVMKMIDQLQEIDCTNIEPLRSVIEGYQRFVPDQISEQDISEKLFTTVPKQGKELAKEVRCFVVPKVVE